MTTEFILYSFKIIFIHIGGNDLPVFEQQTGQVSRSAAHLQDRFAKPGPHLFKDPLMVCRSLFHDRKGQGICFLNIHSISLLKP